MALLRNVLFAARPTVLVSAVSSISRPVARPLAVKWYSSTVQESPKDVEYFMRKDISSQELKAGLDEVYGRSSKPDPKLEVAMLSAAQRLQDSAIMERVLESLKANNEEMYKLVLSKKSEQDFDDKWVEYFMREDIDSWELRTGLNELYGHDLVPEPKVIIAMLKAARRLNDVAMAIRILECVKESAAGNKEIYEYVINAVKPTLEELGINTPEELGLA